MQNVQNLLCFQDKSTSFKVTQNIFVKKEDKWEKVLSGLVKYISVEQTEPFIGIF